MGTNEILAVLERDGFAVVPDVLDAGTIDGILEGLERVSIEDVPGTRTGKAYGIRNLLNVFPMARAIANDWRLVSLIDPAPNPRFRVVRGIFFDKHSEANWKVAWHQDLTIAVRRQCEVEGYGPWSVKAGITHVQPSVSVLENMIALRVHLDETDESNGALRVLPGSHKHGRLNAQDVQAWKERGPVVTCAVRKGGVMLMKPLLLHASSAALEPRHRRVLHFEYASCELEGGLEWFDG